MILQTGTFRLKCRYQNRQSVNPACRGDVSSLDLSILTDEDLASIMSVLELELQVDPLSSTMDYQKISDH